MGVNEFINERTVYLSPFKGRIVVTTSAAEYRWVCEYYYGSNDEDEQGKGVVSRSGAWVACSRNSQDGSGLYVMMINPDIFDLQDPDGLTRFNSVILHETQHVVNNTQQLYGFTAPQEDEPMAYLIQRLFIAISNIIYGTLRLRAAAFNHNGRMAGYAVHGLPDHYRNHATPGVVVAGVINNYYQSNNNVVNYTPAGYTATTYWW